MTTLLDSDAVAGLTARLLSLEPRSRRRWGKMSTGGMLCHLSDSYGGLLRSISPRSTAPWPARYLLRPLALHVPLQWPHGIPTVPEADQLRGGTPPCDFHDDRERTITLMQRFASEKGLEGRPHPVFGPLTEWEWMRWAWLHADHHLRQFSA